MISLLPIGRVIVLISVVYAVLIALASFCRERQSTT